MAEKGKVYQAVIDMAGNIDPSLAKSVDAVQKKLEGVNLKALAIGAAVGTTAVLVGKSVVKATKYLAELGDQYVSALDDMSDTTGLVGEELDNLGEVMKDVYAAGFGDDMQDVAAGLSEVYRTTGLVDDELQAATEAGLALKDSFGYDMSASAEAASAMMKNFGMSADEAYNMIAIGARNGADQNGNMLETLNKYSAQYSALGLSADQFMASLISGNEAGLYSIDKIGKAVKEFNVRSKDLTTTSAKAYESLGFNANDMFARFAAGGDTAQTAMFEVIDALQNTEDATVKNAAASDLFGASYDMLEADLIPVLQTMQDATFGNIGALEQIKDLKFDNISKAFDTIKRQGEVALLPLASTIANAFIDIAPVISDMFEDLSPIIEQTVDDIMPFVEDFLYGAIDALKMLMPYVIELAKRMLPVLSNLVKNLLPPILTLIEALLPPLMDIVIQILPPIMDILFAILPILVNICNMILPAIVQLIDMLLPLIMPLLDLLLVILNEVFMPLLPILVEIVLTLLPPLLSLIEALLPALLPVIYVFGDLAVILARIIGFIGKIVAWVAQGLSWVVDIIFNDSGKADALKMYAAGGFTDGVAIAGEAGTEAIISFDPAYRAQNLAYWAQAGQMLGAETSDYALGSYNGGTVVDIGGIEFAPQITVTGSADKQDIIDAIEESYPEFVDMVERVLSDRGLGVYD